MLDGSEKSTNAKMTVHSNNITRDLCYVGVLI